MSRHVSLVLVVLLCALSTGCFYGRPPIRQLGPDRVLTDAEVNKAEQKIVEAEKAWAARVKPGNVSKSLDPPSRIVEDRSAQHTGALARGPRLLLAR